MARRFRWLSCSWLLFLVAGCSTLPGHPLWGQNATIRPGWTRVGNAAADAALSPATWAPLAGAAICWGSGIDHSVSNWASENTPIFGSQTNASHVSDDLVAASIAVYGLTVIATPSGDQTGKWLENKAAGLGVQAAAIIAANGLTGGLKSAVGRPRPNGGGTQSFPSGHATNVAVLDSLSSTNLEYLPLSPLEQTLSQAGLVTLTAATAWARIEARKHYPSDVLAGIAIGNFFSRFFNDAFLGPGNPVYFGTTIDPADQAYGLNLVWRY